jgi:hypothetical protein
MSNYGTSFTLDAHGAPDETPKVFLGKRKAEPDPESVPVRGGNFRLLSLTPNQYRSEAEISGSFETATLAERHVRRAYSAGVDHANAEWGRASL